MTYDFREVFGRDMARVGLTDAALGAKMRVSQQSVSRWKSRKFPPIRRWRELLVHLGPDSELSKTPHELVFEGYRDPDREDAASLFEGVLGRSMALAGFTESELASRIGVSQAAVNAWKRKGFPPEQRLSAVLDVLGPDCELAQIPERELYAPPENRARAARQFALLPSEVPADLSAQLPGALRQWVVPGAVGKPAYLSPNLLVYIPPTPGAPPPGIQYVASQRTPVAQPNTALLLLELAALKFKHPEQHCVLCVLTDGAAVPPLTSRRLDAAQAMGLDMWVCDTLSALAALIADHEQPQEDERDMPD